MGGILPGLPEARSGLLLGLGCTSSPASGPPCACGLLVISHYCVNVDTKTFELVL